MVSTMGPEYPEYNGDNFRIARNAAPSAYGHAEEHNVGVFVKFRNNPGEAISTEEARAVGQALINLADAIEYDQANRLPTLDEIPNGSVFHFRNTDDPFWTPGPSYIKLTDTTIWSVRSGEVQRIRSDAARTVQIVESDQ